MFGQLSNLNKDFLEENIYCKVRALCPWYNGRNLTFNVPHAITVAVEVFAPEADVL